MQSQTRGRLKCDSSPQFLIVISGMASDDKESTTSKYRRGQRKLGSAHKRFILMMLGRFVHPTEMSRLLKDEDVAEEYGFKPVGLDRATIWKCTRKFTDEEIAASRACYLESLEDIPVASKKYRLDQLQQIIDDEKATLKVKISALAQVYKEIGEDVDKMADALRRGGGQHYVFVGGSDDKQDRQLAAIFGRVPRRFAVSDN